VEGVGCRAEHPAKKASIIVDEPFCAQVLPYTLRLFPYTFWRIKSFVKKWLQVASGTILGT
jgi:hypothetical protein